MASASSTSSSTTMIRTAINVSCRTTSLYAELRPDLRHCLQPEPRSCSTDARRPSPTATVDGAGAATDNDATEPAPAHARRERADGSEEGDRRAGPHDRAA